LFSRARPGQPTPRKVRGFLALPGEIRNIIYGYYFQDDFRCEFAAEGHQFKQPKSRTVTLWSGLVPLANKQSQGNAKLKEKQPNTVRISRLLGKYNVINGLRTNWVMSLFPLNLTCKLVYNETIPFLYRKTVFFFNAPNRINNFLNVVSKAKLKHITRLQLHYSTYGHPKSTQDTIWQNKHRQSWKAACKHISKTLLHLQELEIWVHVHENAPKFNLREKWVMPLLQFRRLTCASMPDEVANTSQARAGSLHIVKIHIRTPCSTYHFGGNQQMVKASTDLHLLFGEAVSLAILGVKEKAAMAGFTDAWEGKYSQWRHHLGFARTGW
jgi:hypothetical protein